MPRKGNIAKKNVLADPIYNSKLVTKLINHLMVDGKKAKASSILYDAFDIIKEKTGKEPVEVFEEAMNNVMPVLEVKARRIGGSNYQVPVEVRPERRTTLGLRWLVSYSRLRNEHNMDERLLMKLWMQQTILAQQLRSVKMCIEWQKLTVHLLTIVSNQLVFKRSKKIYG